MNICIVTVYNTENCGSFWQARALADVLTQLGHSVSFLYRPTNDTSQSFKSHLHQSLAKAVKLNFPAATLVWKKRANYKKAQKCFNVITEESNEFKHIDCFVLGSDTIWNFSSAYFMRHKTKYTGASFLPKKSITYAASAANTPYEVFEADKEIKDAINKISCISVRDEETFNIVKDLTSRQASIVCDPTMLCERELFDRNVKANSDSNYILLYHFANISDEVKKEILNLKKKQNLKVISFGEHRSWCDKTIPYDPYDFVSYFKNANFIITDTFHGTIFSILYNKNFAEYGVKKKKITNLLEQLGLNEVIKTNENSLSFMYENGLDYSDANVKINEIRNESVKFLTESLAKN